MAASAPSKVTTEDIEHATGLELAELEALVQGKDLFVGDDVKWLDAVSAVHKVVHDCAHCKTALFGLGNETSFGN